jgi:hypothetical protein
MGKETFLSESNRHIESTVTNNVLSAIFTEFDAYLHYMLKADNEDDADTLLADFDSAIIDYVVDSNDATIQLVADKLHDVLANIRK